ncbi:hypothetical protein AGDE_14093 [Angomonas deanei]|uniref:Uncharacterized protein n=1 Tax=Angomonas deanei TaxID=59799 RepID=A0A7G2C6E3_9TRYP|nr:hypothetical protein AGDE_14093 [Angomonas deanei]CAD2213522.1 hypothetical protein, conserved [Angomonas deanei]|eukprot:EPY21385.1 hypothetical protein AGDE_14093 [Angomonas deanei]
MFFTYAEKQGSFFSDWKPRQIVFDCTRRYLYYSGQLTEKEMVQPNDVVAGEKYLVSSSGGADRAAASRQPSATIEPDPEPPVVSTQWRRKVKVLAIVLLAKDRVIPADVHAREKDFFQIEIQGEHRTLANGECPPPGPLLCPSTNFEGDVKRMDITNEDYLRDPFFLSELYEALRLQFQVLKEERQKAAADRGETPKETTVQTLQSPRGRMESGPKGSRVNFVLRMRSEYEFRRFWYTVQTVLGYDKLIGRPYRGLPPYDPRNGVVFAQIPMPQWHTFKELDKTVIYTFIKCEMIGRNSGGEFTVLFSNIHLCITHEMLYIMRDTGNIPRWVRIQEVRKFFYNSTCHRPFLVFVADPGTPDLVVVPQPPSFGEISIKYFDRSLAVMRVVSVMKELCFGSIDVRRVTEIIECFEPSAVNFIQSFEQKYNTRLVFDPVPGYFNGMSCPVPKEQLAEVWREVQDMYAVRDQEVLRQSAIPLYTNYANEAPLTTEQMSAISRQLARERCNSSEVVGMSYGEAQELAQQLNQGVLSQSPLIPTRPVENGSFCPNFNTSFAMAASTQSGYGFPESRYLTQDDMATSYVKKLPEVIVDQHTVLASSFAAQGHPPMASSEFRLSDVVNHSFAMYGHSLAKKQQTILDEKETKKHTTDNPLEDVGSLET